MNGEQVTPEPEQEKNEESRARLFPTSGGILRTMDWTEDNGYSRLTIDGTENCIHALKEIMDGTLSNCFIEMSACAGSCVGGPVMEKTIAPRSETFWRWTGMREKKILWCKRPKIP